MPLLWDSAFHQHHLSVETDRDGNMNAVKVFLLISNNGEHRSELGSLFFVIVVHILKLCLLTDCSVFALDLKCPGLFTLQIFCLSKIMPRE